VKCLVHYPNKTDAPDAIYWVTASGELGVYEPVPSVSTALATGRVYGKVAGEWRTSLITSLSGIQTPTTGRVLRCRTVRFSISSRFGGVIRRLRSRLADFLEWARQNLPDPGHQVLPVDSLTT